jgi:16S rRNA (guanine527-N7)-methyltransferase
MLAMKTPDNITHTNVSRETLSPYVDLLLKWNAKINLIGPATQHDIWSRHIDDSMQLLSWIPNTAKTLVDLGSGAGLPGLIIAIAKPELAVTLVEQDQRKAAFLTEVKSRLGLGNVVVRAVDIAAIEGRYDVVTARALAPLEDLLAMAQPLMGQGAICLFPKGETHQQELAQASQTWAFQYTQQASITHDSASIILLSQLTLKHTENR